MLSYCMCNKAIRIFFADGFYNMLGNCFAISLLSVAEPHHLLENKCGKAAFVLHDVVLT